MKLPGFLSTTAVAVLSVAACSFGSAPCSAAPKKGNAKLLSAKTIHAAVNPYLQSRLRVEEAAFRKRMNVDPKDPFSREKGVVASKSFLQGDLDGDGDPDVVVLYALAGFAGYNYGEEFLAVFMNQGGKLSVRANRSIGEPDTGGHTLRAIRGGTIHLDTAVYGPNDPKSTPSRKGTVRYKCVRSRIVKA